MPLYGVDRNTNRESPDSSPSMVAITSSPQQPVGFKHIPDGGDVMRQVPGPTWGRYRAPSSPDAGRKCGASPPRRPASKLTLAVAAEWCRIRSGYPILGTQYPLLGVVRDRRPPCPAVAQLTSVHTFGRTFDVCYLFVCEYVAIGRRVVVYSSSTGGRRPGRPAARGCRAAWPTEAPEVAQIQALCRY